MRFSKEGLCDFSQVHNGLCDPSYTPLLLETSIEAELEGLHGAGKAEGL